MSNEKIMEIYEKINQLSNSWYELTSFEDIREYLNGNGNDNLDLIADLYEDLKNYS